MKPAVQPAAVRPRVVPDHARQATPMLLEELVERWLADGVSGVVVVHGRPGSGKSTALAHLACRFPSSDRLELLDEPRTAEIRAVDPRALVVCTSTSVRPPSVLARLELAPWGEDEWIEYLLARHATACASVMARLRAARDADELHGVAELCSAALDGLAEDDKVPGAVASIMRHVDRRLGSTRSRRSVATDCLEMYLHSGTEVARQGALALERKSGDAWRLLRHPEVMGHFAARGLVRSIEKGRAEPDWLAQLPRDFERRAAPLVRASRRARGRLRAWLDDGTLDSASVASLWHAADPEDLARWLRARRKPLGSSLAGARLRRAPWDAIDLSRSDLSRTDLAGASLRGADLGEALLQGAMLTGADLEHAELGRALAGHAHFDRARLDGCNGPRAKFAHASFDHADLEVACLSGSSFDGTDLTAARFLCADLRGASFRDALLQETDFRGADLDSADLSGRDLRSCELSEASLRHAKLSGAHMEGMQLDGVDLRSAKLQGAHLTGASLRGAKLSLAALADSHLADIDAQGADLRDADLSRASFHMGSSRSGLVFDAMPMEGSRTGFYTDDYFDNTFRRPEDVRKANLHGADLRGAQVAATDFYLVDLRAARCTPDQFEHFRRCGAILDRP